ncbi:MAG: M48 family metallopeptidase [Synergistaceae bacterium]|jgi:putative metalloprotease|nr:M48 family metallopeptidase [Synergistaceae bacterium]
MKKILSGVLVLLAACLFGSAADASIGESSVRRAWKSVTGIAEMDELPLFIKEDAVPNAWVEAGKSVTVTTGLMKLLEREEEIFGVLSHEAGHAKLKHYESRVKQSVGLSIAALLLGKAIGDSALGDLAVGVGTNLASAGYSREKEVEADDFAVDLAFKGGLDPTGLYTALSRLSLQGGRLEPSGFNSHPPDARRLSHVKERILKRAPDTKFPEVKAPKGEKKGEKK